MYSFFIELYEIRLEILYLKRGTVKVFSSLRYKMDYRNYTICFYIGTMLEFSGTVVTLSTISYTVYGFNDIEHFI